MKFAFISAFVLISFLAVAQNTASSKVGVYSKNNFSIRYPASWAIDTSRKMGAELFIFSPAESTTDQFRENINVLIQNLAGQNVNLSRYKQITEKQIADLGAGGKLLESSIVNPAKPCYKVMYEMTQGASRLKIKSFCYIQNQKAYLVTFTSEIGKYDRYQKISDAILNSFAVKK